MVILSIGIFFLQFHYKKTYQPHTYYQVYLDEEVVGIIAQEEELEKYISEQGTLIKEQVIEYQKEVETLKAIDALLTSKVKGSSTYFELVKKYDELYRLVGEKGTFKEEAREEVEKLFNSLTIDRKDSYVAQDHIAHYENLVEGFTQTFHSQKQALNDFLKANLDKLKLTESERYQVDTYFNGQLQEISYPKQKYMENYIETNEAYLYSSDIYSPIGIHVEKINTYHADLKPVEEVYDYIVSKKPCTIEGYQFRIKKNEEQDVSPSMMVGAYLLEDYQDMMDTRKDDVIVYVTKEEVFKEAVEELEAIFTGSEAFENYQKGTQEEIKDTGSRIDDVYISEGITVKKENISIGEKIYNDADELSSYLLYGDNKNEKTIYAKATDNILSLTYEQGITLEEFFLSNPSFTSVNNIFYNNQPIVIAQTDPKISVVVESYTVEDKEVNYDTVEEYSSSLNKGMREVKQKGKNGVERVSQSVRSVNGAIAYIKPDTTTTLKKAQNEIILVGTKDVPGVGSLSSWYWPTRKGYSISSYYGYRKNPFGSGRELHTGLDIAGTGYGSPVYASNNGEIIYMGYQQGGYGTHMIIDHHNGYYTLYGHMSGYAKGMREGIKVARGQVIGYVGSSGAATGPHLHFEIRRCKEYSTRCFLNPLPYLRK